MSEFETLDEQTDALGTSLDDATGMTAGFNQELRRMHKSMAETERHVSKLEKSLSSGLSKAIDGLILDGMKLSDALGVVANSMIEAAYKAAVKPVTDQLGGLLTSGIGKLIGGILPFEKGASFSQGRVTPFANGGVVSGPVTFPMRGGMGLMGEAGPEAIMPLARGADGKLGIRAAGGGQGVTVVMNISTPDVQGFRRSQSQIAAQMGRALSRGARNR